MGVGVGVGRVWIKYIQKYICIISRKFMQVVQNGKVEIKERLGDTGDWSRARHRGAVFRIQNELKMN